MRYVIKRLVLGSPHEVELRVEEYDRIKEARETLTAIGMFEDAFLLLMENHIEIEKYLFEYALTSLTYANFDSIDFGMARIKINQKLNAILAAAKYFNDSIKQHLEFVGESTLSEITNFRSQQYDSSKAYRLMELLKNLSQHQEMPIEAISLDNSWEDNWSRMRVTLIPFVTSRTVLKSNNLKQVIREDLSGWEKGKIELMPRLRAYIERIGKIHEFSQGKFFEIQQSCERELDAAGARYISLYPAEGSLGLVAVESPSEYVYENPIYIRIPNDEHRERVQSRTRTMHRFSDRYVGWR
ncbi:hypothetical protein [Zavarzinia sp. CC-PAN008]|uniref:hypothetical protein n=1 Tax=Zavarzinia sp. CC-PAN008 TaxID=3243332 RepID=UPI003F7447CF